MARPSTINVGRPQHTHLHSFMRPFRTRVVRLPTHRDGCNVQIDFFQHQYYKPQKPVKYAASAFGNLNKIPARTSWIRPYATTHGEPFAGSFRLNHDHFEPYGDTTVPIERTVWEWTAEGKKPSVTHFERFEAPLSFFLEWTKHKLADPHNFAPNEGLYIAQCPINQLPEGLRRELPAPVYCTMKSDSEHKSISGREQALGGNLATQPESSSIWMGIPPTETPLHKDPNDNFLVQLAGYKSVRLVEPGDGEFMLAYAKRSIAMGRSRDVHGRSGGRLDMSMRGEEMMVGPERELMGDLVWGESLDGNEESIEIQETVLEPGDALFIPKGWYHSVRSLGTVANGINLSANWWFRFKAGA